MLDSLDGGRYASQMGSNPLFHHPDDRWPDAMNIDKTRRTTKAMVRLVADLAKSRRAAGTVARNSTNRLRYVDRPGYDLH